MGGEFFRSAPKLKLVQLLSAGYDRVDIEAARKAKVPVSNNGGANAIAVAEHTLMLILAVLKRVVQFHNDVVAGKWRVGGFADHARSTSWRASTLGIVGLGNIGKKVARRAPRLRHGGAATTTSAGSPRTRRTRSACASRSSPSCCGPPTCVSLHVPLDDVHAQHDVGARELALMKRDARSSSTRAGGR